MTLDDWLTSTKTSNAAFAARANWSGETIRRYRSGAREPDIAAMAVIFDLTDGNVTPNDWAGVGPRNRERSTTPPSELSSAIERQKS
jgi:hypothetical protein